MTLLSTCARKRLKISLQSNIPCSEVVDLLVTYSNRSDLREQLQRVAVILPEAAGQNDELDSSAESEVRSATRWWSLRDRLSAKDLHTMIDLLQIGHDG